eukprot:c17260_g1_i1 orf=382-780(-)
MLFTVKGICVTSTVKVGAVLVGVSVVLLFVAGCTAVGVRTVVKPKMEPVRPTRRLLLVQQRSSGDSSSFCFGSYPPMACGTTLISKFFPANAVEYIVGLCLFCSCEEGASPNHHLSYNCRPYSFCFCCIYKK